MSFESNDDDSLFLLPDPPPKWFRPNAARITLENCVKGTGPMVRMKAGELAGKGGGATDAVSEKPQTKAALVHFGKYRGRLIVDVNEEDPQYIQWCIRDDIQGMREKCEAVGVTQEDL